MLIKIEIDTNNTNYNPDKYPYNEELWNIVVPNIKFLGEPGELTDASKVDWGSYKKEVRDSNGHCVYIEGNCGYIAAYEYEDLWFEEDWLKSVADFTYPNQPLSHLLAEIAKKNKINWKYLEEYNSIKEENSNKSSDLSSVLSIWNQYKLIQTPLTKILDKDKK